MGRSRQELIGLHQSRLHPPEEEDIYKEKFRTITNRAAELGGDGETFTEGEIINSAGERIPVYISASLLEIGGRKVSQGIFRDMSEIKRIEREKKEAEALALIDPHTQLYNYRYFQRRIHSEFELAKRRSTPLSVLMVDIDYFKSVNDTFGHEFGDVVLQEFAILLQHTCRGIDVVTRFEGEGFAIILPDTDGRGAFAFAERIQKIVKKHHFGTHRVKLRVSVGVASYPEDGMAAVDGLLTMVEKCVRLAKEQGGNTIAALAQLRKRKAGPAPSDKDSKERVSAITKKFMDLLRRNRQNTIEAVYALAHTVGAKNEYTEEHSEDMVKYCTEVARKLKLSDEDIEDIKHGAMLHDIGKLGISEKILLKRGKLTERV
jgi:diguanylate cyclase (GGDEF)-like protein/PAS domain S-box-containing protein